MHIGIDGYESNTTQRVGIGQYGFQLLTHMHKIDHSNEYTIFLPTAPLGDMPPQNSRWRYVIGKPGTLWTIRQLPGLIKKTSLDVFFSPTHYAPWFTRIPKVISIMDLSYLHFPDMFRRKDYLQLRYMGEYSIRNAQKILTISEFSKSEIVNNYGKKNGDIVVTYPGKNSIIADQQAKIGLKVQELLSTKYILFVGTIQPRKNIVRLVDAFEQLHEDVHLVIVGKKGWIYEPIIKRIELSVKKDKIVRLDFVTDYELIMLYKSAKCFVLPSLYEGFGMPVIDALSYGCLVVVSNTSSLPEVAGEGGIKVDPEDTKSIAGGLTKALQLTAKDKERITKLGITHIQKFDWKVCAQKTIDVLRGF